MQYCFYYLLFINLLAFSLMGADKHKARRGLWRIPERWLFLSAILGGSVGAILGMQCFRHKTKHRKFVVGMPLILVLQILLTVGFLIWYRSGIELLAR